MIDLLEEYIDQTIAEEYQIMTELKIHTPAEVKKIEQDDMMAKFSSIINKEEYKYYAIYNYCNPYKAAGIGALAGSGGSSGYINMGHYTLYGSNIKPFSKQMLSSAKAATVGNPWKKEMKAKTLKGYSQNYIKKKSDIPQKLQKYVIE